MSKLLMIPSEVKEYEFSNKDAEVVILHKDLERFDIKYAPALKKIISLSEYVVFGPAEAKGEVPILNKCPKLNEIITFGYIKFNTMVVTNGTKKSCAWTGIDEIPPVLTSVEYEYIGDFPCYYYDTKAPLEEIDSTLIYASPLIRECPIRSWSIFMEKSLINPSEVGKPIVKEKKLTF